MKRLFLFLLLTPGALVSFSQIIYIPTDQPTIQEGIIAATPGDTILVEEGIYSEQIELKDKPLIIGSLFLTTGDESYISNTVIDGAEQGTVVHIHPDQDRNTHIVGLTIRNGIGNEDGNGGGIYLSAASPVLRHLIITENTAARGAGIYCAPGSDLFLENTTIKNNTGYSRGAGITSYDSFIDIKNCQIIENELTDGRGTAIFFYISEDSEINQTAQIYSSIIANNSLLGEGGTAGVYISKPDLTPEVVVHIEDCIFESNSGPSSTALRMIGLDLRFKVINCSFIANEAQQFSAGASFTGHCGGEVINCLFAKNKAALNGGEWSSGGATVWNRAGVFFVNCTFTENTASYGNALILGGASAQLFNCIFWNNGNAPISLTDFQNQGSDLVINFSNLEEGIESIASSNASVLMWDDGNIAEDPLFKASGNHTYSLKVNSPCIDAGNPNAGNLPPNDLIGNMRIWDGNNDANAIVDMGPYEYGSIPLGANEHNFKHLGVLNYPNPFPCSTTLSYSLKQPSTVQISVFNQLGQIVYQHSEEQQQGKQQLQWDAHGLAEGVYYYRLQAGDQVANGKMVKAQ